MVSTISTAVLEDGQPRLEIDEAEIRVTSGPDKGSTFTLDEKSVLIGSEEQCEIVLHDATVSGRHAEIACNESGFFIRDLGSTNGIVLGAHNIDRAPLADGMKLRLGNTVLSVHALGKKRQIPLAARGAFHGLVATSLKMRALVAQLEQVSPSDATILIEGETGTGKEVVAQAIHRASTRAGGPFVVFDCGAIQPSLAAAELFGHEKGAFSGADQSRAGLFEEADGGTLFLDEIGELPLDLQPVLLRALERKTSRRVGGNSEVQHDVRIVAATNRNLAEEVKRRRFREDLYYRLAVVRLRVPPLRERPEDLAGLARHFASEVGVSLTPDALLPLASYRWPGNVRELRNMVSRLIAEVPAVGDEPVGLSDPLLEVSGEMRPLPEARRLANEEFERRYLERVLSKSGGNVTRAAELAGISRRVLQLLCAKHGKVPRS